ncbi:MAG: hypothetical protein EOL91_07145 [Actinobacteria bacterium]|nr:hypothetical protein [Actinomycetota bacterium]
MLIVLVVGTGVGCAPNGDDAQSATQSTTSSPVASEPTLTALQRLDRTTSFDREWSDLPHTEKVEVCDYIDYRGLDQAMSDFGADTRDGFLPGLFKEACDELPRSSPTADAPSQTASPVATTPALTDQERAFLEAHRDQFSFRPPKPDAALLAWAREHCVKMAQERADDRAEFIQSRWGGGEGGNANERAVASYFCPELLPDMDLADRAFGPGNVIAIATYEGPRIRGIDEPDQVAAGTYTTLNTGLEGCYWERVSSNGSTIANDFLSFVPGTVTVTIKAGEGFTSNGCGLWIPAG